MKNEQEIMQEPESFQKAMQELKEIVNALENTDSDLDKSLLLFKRGSFLSKWAENYLQAMEEEIVKITGEEEIKPE